jgi:VWFA-related protein
MMEQRRMMSLALEYVARTIPLLPNLLAKRETTHFEDTPLLQQAFGTVPYQALHLTGTSMEEVAYRAGREEARPEVRGTRGGGKPTKGLATWGVFGPIAGMVFEDASHGTLVWSHWEQGRGGIEAVFRYAVPAADSHYSVNYCCVARQDGGNPSTFRQIAAYHGEIGLNPDNGTVLRLTIQAELRATDPVKRADISVEYGPVEIGGRTYICPVRSIAASRAEQAQMGYSGPLAARGALALVPHPTQMLVNDVRFDQYQVFRADARILEPEEAKSRLRKPATEATSAGSAEPTVSKGNPIESGQEVAPEQEGPAGTVKTDANLPKPASPLSPSAGEQRVAIPNTTQEKPTLRTTTREVVVDVVVRDAGGQPVSGLGREDFEIDEDGKKQAIDFFEAHSGDSPPSDRVSAMPSTEVGARMPEMAPGNAVTVLLLDTLNTEQQDQIYVHHQIDRFLEAAPAGTRMAIVVLGAKLRFIQGFTADVSALRAALDDEHRGAFPEKQSVYHSRSDLAADAGDIAALNGMKANSTGSSLAIQGLEDALANMGAVDQASRASMTFEALDTLAGYLSDVPGRKNLIWFSSSFPVTIFPSPEEEKHLVKRSAEYLSRFRRTSGLLTAARVAIYPVTAEGVMAEHVAEADTAGSGGMPRAARLGGGREPMSAYNQGAAERANAMASVDRIAESTGGKAFYNTNDFGKVIRQTTEDGSNYYTISYSPKDTKMDGSYRRIEVRLKQRGMHPGYRRGYYADDGVASEGASTLDPLAPVARPAPLDECIHAASLPALPGQLAR